MIVFLLPSSADSVKFLVPIVMLELELSWEKEWSLKQGGMSVFALHYTVYVITKLRIISYDWASFFLLLYNGRQEIRRCHASDLWTATLSTDIKCCLLMTAVLSDHTVDRYEAYRGWQTLKYVIMADLWEEICVYVLKFVLVLGNWLTYTFGEGSVAVVAAPVQDKSDKLKV